MKKQNTQPDRYEEILQKNTSTLNMLKNIEQSQGRRRFKIWIKRMWYKLTFQNHKNEQQKVTKGRVS
jgi:hypothetical protein